MADELIERVRERLRVRGGQAIDDVMALLARLETAEHLRVALTNDAMASDARANDAERERDEAREKLAGVYATIRAAAVDPANGVLDEEARRAFPEAFEDDDGAKGSAG